MILTETFHFHYNRDVDEKELDFSKTLTCQDFHEEQQTDPPFWKTADRELHQRVGTA